ncbi:AP endonuclease [Euryarchaeota archaeon ex4484_178]|nr:MAG: AP endonuclease [Euryarchaeota archaeon ex4484_178]
MYRFGLAGIPLSCKGRTLKDAIEDTHRMGLHAMEIQFLRVNVQERSVFDEVGLTPREVETSLIVDVLRPDEEGNYRPIGIDSPLEEDDIVLELFWNLARNYGELKVLGELAKELDIQLSLHTPYYMDLVSNSELTEKSLDYIVWGGLLANEMDAKYVVSHIGLYGELSKAQAMKNVIANVKYLRDKFKELKLKPKLGFENSGKRVVFGSLDEILTISKKVKGVLPIVNFAHLHGRTNGELKEAKKFEEVFEKIAPFWKSEYYVHFAGVFYENGNETMITAIKKGDLKFETLANVILQNEYNITLISSSPLLEHDAAYMRVIMERVLLRKLSKLKG